MMITDLIKAIFWLVFFSWWECAIFSISYIAGVIWANIKSGWYNGSNKTPLGK